MYRISLSSLLVVLVTLQQHNSAAAESLCKQFDDLIKVLNVDHLSCDEDNVCLSDSITYDELKYHLKHINAKISLNDQTIHSEYKFLEQLFFNSLNKEASHDEDNLTFSSPQYEYSNVETLYQQNEADLFAIKNSFYSNRDILSFHCTYLI